MVSLLAAPRVSVVIPVYDRAATVERAVTSVLAQSFADFEVVVVDDGSTDGGCDRIAERDPRIRVLRHAANRGPSAARNTGIAASRGEFVAFLDSDDEWLPEKLAHQLEALGHCGASVDAVASAFMLVDDADGRRRAVRAPFRRDPWRSVLLGCTLGPGSTLMCRRSWFTQGGGFDERLRRLEDWAWLLAFCRERHLLLTEEPVAVVHGGNAAAVAAALTAMEEDHWRAVSGRGWLARRMFRSTLALERAACAWRAGDVVRCCALLLRSVALYPFRGEFFARALDRVFHRALERIAGARSAEARAAPGLRPAVEPLTRPAAGRGW
jgi:glycosyltransferase involved in cell wall biosynthesis